MTRLSLFAAGAYTFFAYVAYTVYTNYGSATGNFDGLILLFACIAVCYSLADKYYLKSNLIYDDKKRPVWLTYTADSWIIAVLILVFRGVFFEATYVPTASLEPSVMVGDFVLVNKTAYSYKFPGVDEPLIYKQNPKLGDIVVFNQYKSTQSGLPERWVKRVVGTPGSVVEYDFYEKRLIIDGVAMNQDKKETFSKDGIEYTVFDETISNYSPLLSSQDFINRDIVTMTHKIQTRSDYSVMLSKEMQTVKGCTYTETTMRCVVPEDSFFMMGDNRDDSYDSRFWGFVHKKDIIGKAFLTVFNFKSMSRPFIMH